MKIILEQKKCIGCGSCAAICPKHFKMGKNNKSELIDAKKDKDDIYEKEIVKVTEEIKDAESSCPAMCIHIKK
jgi:ferredoxin